MLSLVTVLQQKQAKFADEPYLLGAAAAEDTPKKWEISVVSVIRAGIPKYRWKEVFRGYKETKRAM